MAGDGTWINARIATMAAGHPGLGIIEPGAIVARAGRIVWAGPMAERPAAEGPVTDLGGRWVTPGLVDCHTHLVYAGNRAREFELRLSGASYEEIARGGGGILSTVAATRAADEEALLAAALPRLDDFLAEGVTTLEVKSGYGLDRDSEMRMLRAARRLGQARPVSIFTSHLGAHALPPEYAGDPDGYIAAVIDDQLPAAVAAGLVDAVDGFCERIAFTRDQIARLFDAADRLGLPVKVHAEQLSDQGGAALAARYRALSADHLEYLSEEGAAAMAAAGSVAVLLPGAFYFLRERKAPPVEALRLAGVPIAVASDHNPGSSPLYSLLLAANMAATLFALTVEECLLGVTRNAARALGKLDEVGTIEAGKWCDLAIWEIEAPADLVYRIGCKPLHARIWRGT